MPSNVVTNLGSGGATWAAPKVTFDGDSCNVSMVVHNILTGTEDAYTMTQIVAGAGAVNAGVQRVTLASDDPGVTHLATVAGDTTSLDAKVTACNTGAVVVASGAITATLADETTKVIGTVNVAAGQSIAATQSGAWNVTNVSGSISLPTGASTLAEQQTQTGHLATLIGHVDGVESSLVDAVTALQIIDDWDETNRAKVNLIVGQAGIAAGAGAVGVTVPRVTLASDDPAVVDLAAIEVLATTIAGDTTSLDGKVTACNTGAVVIASGTVTTVTTVGAVTAITNALPAGTNAIGKLAANSGVDIGDVDVTSIAAGTNTIGGVISQPSTSAAYDGTTACTIKRLSGIATASGANTIIAAVADKKIRVLALSLLATSTTAVVAYLYNGDYMLLGDGTNKLTLDMDGVGGPAGLVMPFNQGGWFQTDTANEALTINLGGATPVIWAITYMEVA